LKNEGEKDEAILSKEEAEFLKREVTYLTKKVESLQTHNHELVSQLGRMKSKFEGLRERYLSPINTPRGQQGDDSKMLSLKSQINLNTETDSMKFKSESFNPLDHYITEENDDDNDDAFQNMLEGKSVPSNKSVLSTPAMKIDVENILQMLLLQSQLIESKITNK